MGEDREAGWCSTTSGRYVKGGGWAMTPGGYEQVEEEADG